MSIVQEDAVRFSKFFPQNCVSIKLGKEKLEEKLYNFTLVRNKLDFLNSVRTEMKKMEDDHKTKCQKTSCRLHQAYQIAQFVINEELESISEYHTPEIKNDDKFSIEEQIDLNIKIDEILSQLEILGYGQEIIFTEIDELRQHFSLGKKNWKKFLSGTLLTVSSEKVVENAIVEPIYQKLTEGLSEVTKFLDM